MNVLDNFIFQLKNLRKRMKKYGDITQNARDAGELEELLCRFNNRVPAVIFFLEERVRAKGTQAKYAHLANLEHLDSWTFIVYKYFYKIFQGGKFTPCNPLSKETYSDPISGFATGKKC